MEGDTTIDNAIKGAKGQARNLILHIQSGIKVKDAVAVAKNRLSRSKSFDRILIITARNRIINLNK